MDKYWGILTVASIENSERVLIPEMGHKPPRKILTYTGREITRFLNKYK